MKERLQKLMAQAGIASRRASEELIEQGRVRVNGQVAKLGDKADLLTDTVEVDGQKLAAAPTEKLYVALNKPVNVVSNTETHRDDTRQTARELIPFKEHLFAIGRLDADSSGLMVFTNDGELTNRLTHPRYRHSKTYRVVVESLPPLEIIKQWEMGVVITDEDSGAEYKTAPCSVRIARGGKDTVLEVVMTEGKKRQIRRVAAALGYPVKRLTRTHIGALPLGKLRPGEWRVLDAEEIALLKQPGMRISRPKIQRGPWQGSESSSGHSRRGQGGRQPNAGERSSQPGERDSSERDSRGRRTPLKPAALPRRKGERARGVQDSPVDRQKRKRS